MDLSDAFWLTAAFVVLCGYYIGEKIIDVDFSCFLPKNLKKAKMKRLLAKRSTPLEGTKIKKTIKKASGKDGYDISEEYYRSDK